MTTSVKCSYPPGNSIKIKVSARREMTRQNTAQDDNQIERPRNAHKQLSPIRFLQKQQKSGNGWDHTEYNKIKIFVVT